MRQIELTRAQAVARAIAMSHVKPTRYVLGAGGRSPAGDTPFTVKDGVTGSDCVGFTNWCVGLDRYQEHVKAGCIGEYGGWINCDSAMGDAETAKVFFEYTDTPTEGDLVVYPSKWGPAGSRSKALGGRHGHIGMIVDVDVDTSNWTSKLWARPASERKNFLRHLTVIDCAAALSRRLVGRAIQETTAAKGGWNKPDARFLRYRHFFADKT